MTTIFSILFTIGWVVLWTILVLIVGIYVGIHMYINDDEIPAVEYEYPPVTFKSLYKKYIIDGDSNDANTKDNIIIHEDE